MKKLIAWITDPHLNFLPLGGAASFALGVREDYPGLTDVVITGDIGEFHNFVELTNEFADAVEVPVWFVFGNHDCYGGSIDKARIKARSMRGNARWLVEEKLVEITKDTALVGHDGWYDARNGEPTRSNVVMNDFIQIREFIVSSVFTDMYGSKISMGEASHTAQGIADTFAKEARPLLENAVEKGYKHILFATHVPPYALSTWHEGKISDKNWLPWMSSRVMGELIDSVARKNPDVQFTVLCGHTHSSGVYKPHKNVEVKTGHAAYRHPRVCGTFGFEEE